MKTNKKLLAVSQLTLAVQGALVVMFAMPPAAFAADEAVEALTQPINTVEIGVVTTPRDSAKFGQYNGLNKSESKLFGNFDVRGGAGYKNETSLNRWEIQGTDLGTTSQEFKGSVSNQGQWNLGFGYDELRHNLSDSYQTPYLGDMGGNTFVLPAGFGTIANTNLPLTLGQQAAMHNVDIGTTRKNTSLNAGYSINPRLNVKFDFNHLDQSGAKLMAFGSMAHAGAGGEVVSILPNPTKSQTDTFDLALNWTGDKSYLTASYFGSLFHQGYDRVTFQTYGGANDMQTMSTAPSNEFHQLNLSGGYNLAAKTKLTGGLSIGRNTQNDQFSVDPFMYVTGNTAPGNLKTSLDGLVETTHADIKLTDQTTKNLTLSASIKYDERNNKTQSNIYNFNAISGSASNIGFYPNTPLSNKKTQLELASDYRIDKDQHIRFSYNREEVKRWCNQYATGTGNTAVGTILGGMAYANGVNNYPAGTNCVVATASLDDKISAVYKTKPNEDVNLNVGYSISKRKTDSDPNAIAAFIGLNGNAAAVTSVPTGLLASNYNATLIRGVNGGDYLGFYPYFDASRTQQMLKAGVNWQANEKLALGVGGKYTDDSYDSTYGVQKGSSWSVNLDSTYNYSDTSSVTAYLTQQSKNRDLTDLYRSPYLAASAASATALNIPSGATWTNNLRDDDITFGIGSKKGGLMNGKLEIAGDLSYSISKSVYGTQLNYSAATTTGVTCSDPRSLICGQLPDIKSETLTLKVTGTYQVDKASKFAVGYMFQQQKSDDYYYNGLQTGNNANTMLATNQQAPNYAVNVVTVSYIYSFR